MTSTKHLKYAEYLTNFLDTKYTIFGLKIGLDPFLDFIPILGPLISTAMSLYLLWIGLTMKVSNWIIGRMLLNILFDYFIGNIPFLGFFGDLIFKANVRNLALLKNNINSSDILVGDLI